MYTSIFPSDIQRAANVTADFEDIKKDFVDFNLKTNQFNKLVYFISNT